MRAKWALLLLFASPLLAPGAAPAPQDPSLLLRWPASADEDERFFGGGDFRALAPAPIVGTGPFSVSLWANPADLAGGEATYGRGLARSTRGDQVGDWVLAVTRDGRVRFYNWRVKGDDRTGSHTTKKPWIAPGTWAHIAATWDGKASRIFVNGVEADHIPGSTATGWGVGHEVGRSWTSPGYFWDGQITGLRVYRRALSPGEIAPTVKFGPRIPPEKAPGPSGDPKVSAALDRIILAKLKKAGLSPAGPADDSEFLRRVALDLVGRVPTDFETEAFLADRSPDKRGKLIDALLGGPEMPMAWSQVLAGWLLPKASRRDTRFVGWLRTGLARNKSWARLAREMLDPATASSGGGLFLGSRLAALQDHSIAGDIGRALFGVNLRCAQCHDHPHVREWTLERFNGLSAFYARTYQHPGPGGATLAERATGEMTYASHGKKLLARPTFLDGTVVPDPPLPPGFKEAPRRPNVPPTPPPYSRRAALARVALSGKARLFSRATVNRVWRRLMGRGLVEPVDMMHDGNPPTHPELLDLLAEDFAANNFDLRRLIAVIVRSDAYARSGRWPGEGKLPAPDLYAVAAMKPLDADQLALSLALASGYYAPSLKAGTSRALARLRLAGPWREVAAEFDSDEDEFEPTTAQALFLTNSDHVRTAFLKNSNLVRGLAALTDDAAVARRAYLSVLSRLPTAAEVALVRRFLRARAAKGRDEACRGLLWALLSGSEFRFNH